MATAQSDIDRLTAELTTAGTDATRLMAVSLELVEAQSKLTAAEEDWLRFSAEAEGHNPSHS